MKRITLLTSAFFALFALQAQDSEDGMDKTPSGGEKNLELHLTPFGNTPISVDGIRFRSFGSGGSSAIRVNFSLNTSSNTEVTQQEVDSIDQEKLETTTSSFMLGIAPGYEMHLGSSKSVDPYVGATLPIRLKSTTYEEQRQSGDDVETLTVSNGTKASGAPAQPGNFNRAGYFSFGLRLVSGVDYYFAKNIYLGAEFGYGFESRSYSDIEFEDTDSDANLPDPQEQGSEFSLGSGAVGELRVGYNF